MKIGGAMRTALGGRLGLVIAAAALFLASGGGCSSTGEATTGTRESELPTGAAPAYSDAFYAKQNDPTHAVYDVLTQHNDIARTGAAVHEDVLTPAGLRSGAFGRRPPVHVRGQIYAQPLFVEQAAVKCGASPVANVDIAYVATLENIVYAIDVENGKICWETAPLGPPQPMPWHPNFNTRARAGVSVGIVSTPVIDLAQSVLYAVSREFTSGAPHFFLNSVDTRTGAVVGRTEVTAGAGIGCGQNVFSAARQANRPGLLLVQNKLFLAFGSTAGEDSATDYHGYVVGFDVRDPARPTRMPKVFCSTPTARGGGIWMAGNGLVSDGSSIYFTTGNGAYTVENNAIHRDEIPNSPAGENYPESFLKLDVATLARQAVFADDRPLSDLGAEYLVEPRSDGKTASIFYARERADADLGGGGIALVGNRLLGGGKDAVLYSLDPRDLHRVESFRPFFDADTNDGANPEYVHQYSYRTMYYDGPNMHGGPVAWDLRGRGGVPYSYVYSWSEKDALKRFKLYSDAGTVDWVDARNVNPEIPTPSVHGTIGGGVKSMPGGMLSLSANGVTGGIVWAVVEEPFAKLRMRHPDCGNDPAGGYAECEGCMVTDKDGTHAVFDAHCDAAVDFVPGRLYAFSADDDGVGALPLLWGDKRSADPNNVIERYSKLTPPTVAHGRILIATRNDELQIFGPTCTHSPCTPPRRRDDLMAVWDEGYQGGEYASFAEYPSAGASFPGWSQWSTRDGGFFDGIRWLSADFDGDGLTDVAAVWNDAGNNRITVRRSTGSSLAYQEHWTPARGAWADENQWLAGDYDGDGMADIVQLSAGPHGTRLVVYSSAKTHFKPPVDWPVGVSGWGPSFRWLSGDFNGDGLSDVAAVSKDVTANTITVWQSTRSSFGINLWAIKQGQWLDSTAWVAGDFDGDGRTDIAGIANDRNASTVTVYRSLGNTFSGMPWNERDRLWSNAVRWVAGDFNGDGRDDIASVENLGNANAMYVRTSTGWGFSTSSWGTNLGGWSSLTRWLPGKYR